MPKKAGTPARPCHRAAPARIEAAPTILEVVCRTHRDWNSAVRSPDIIGWKCHIGRKACAEALADAVHSADVVLNILSRHRDPAPAATILTPDALQLRHQPIADCARYDSLRRAS